MRIAIAAVLAAAIAAGLGFAADAAPTKKKNVAPKQRAEAVQPPRGREERFGFDATPDHYRFGSDRWWRAMEREGRGGFGDTM